MRCEKGILPLEGHAVAEARVEGVQGGGHAITTAKIESLGRGDAFDGEDLLGVVEDAPEFERTVCAHADVVFLAV